MEVKFIADYWNVGIVAMMVTFIGGFAILIAYMPTQFFVVGNSPEWKQYNYPTYWSAPDIESLKYHLNYTIEYHLWEWSGNWYDFNTASPSFNVKLVLEWYPLVSSGPTYFELRRLTGWFIVNQWSWLYWENASHYHLSLADLVSHWDSEVNASKFAPVTDLGFHCVVWFADYNSSRNDIYQAWIDKKINCEIAFGLEGQQVTYTAWDLIGKLLFFQAWDICGSVIINALIALPLWSAIIYIVIRIILLFIPFLGD